MGAAGGGAPTGNAPGGSGTKTGTVPSGSAPSGSGSAPSAGTPGGSASSNTFKTAEKYLEYLNSDTHWVSYDSSSKKATVHNLEGFVKSQKPATKDVGAFDGIARGETENLVLGHGTNPLRFARVSRSVIASHQRDQVGQALRRTSLNTGTSPRSRPSLCLGGGRRSGQARLPASVWPRCHWRPVVDQLVRRSRGRPEPRTSTSSGADASAGFPPIPPIPPVHSARSWAELLGEKLSCLRRANALASPAWRCARRRGRELQRCGPDSEPTKAV